MTAKPDKAIKIWAASATVTWTHLLGRSRDGRPVHVFGQRWRSILGDGDSTGSWFELRAISRDDDGQIMCEQCGSFDLDKPGGYLLECQGCDWREVGD